MEVQCQLLFEVIAFGRQVLVPPFCASGLRPARTHRHIVLEMDVGTWDAEVVDIPFISEEKPVIMQVDIPSIFSLSQ